MRDIHSVLIVALLCNATLASAQNGALTLAPLTSAVPAASPTQLLLAKDTPIHLMVLNEVSTKVNTAGFRFPLLVNQPVIVDGKTMVPVGTKAWGEVVTAEKSGNVGKSGRLAARLLYIDLAGRHIAISGETQAKGKSGTEETVMGVIGLGVLGLFAKGNNAKIKAGELMTAFTVQDEPFASEPAISSSNRSNP